MSAALTEQLGPDRSRVIYRFDDGWTIRKLEQVNDQLREGHLAENCLRDIRRRLEDPSLDGLFRNCYSLRDADNLPHATFSAWRRLPGTLAEYFEVYEPDLPPTALRDTTRIVSRSVMFDGSGRGSSRLKDAYRRRLLEFSESDAAKRLEELPCDPLRFALLNIGV